MPSAKTAGTVAQSDCMSLLTSTICLNLSSELRSCFKLEMDVHCSPFLIVRMVSMDIKQHFLKKRKKKKKKVEMLA